jgi:hypothetical protein
MCGVEFDGYNDFTCETKRKARKQHRCRECRNLIEPGQTYTHHSSLYDGHVSTHKTCQKCDRVEEAHAKAERAMGGDASFYVGELLDTVKECTAEHPEYRESFRLAWRGEEVLPYAGPKREYPYDNRYGWLS